jgi:hypothetical protein
MPCMFGLGWLFESVTKRIRRQAGAGHVLTAPRVCHVQVKWVGATMRDVHLLSKGENPIGVGIKAGHMVSSGSSHAGGPRSN